MIYEKETEWTGGKLLQLYCDCEEFRNNTGMTCRHIREEREKQWKYKEKNDDDNIGNKKETY